MRTRDGNRWTDVIAGLGAVALLTGLLVVLTVGVSVAPIRFSLLAFGGIALFVAWWRLRRAGLGLSAAAARATERAEQAEKRVRQAETGRRTADQRAERFAQARTVEREWNRELRDQLQRLYREHRSLTDGADVQSLVLQTAMMLLEADKGVMLARRDADGDGQLDLVAARGFDGDPERSATVQRLARKVDERDHILHEDTADDPEIENLVAIPVWIADDFAGVVVCANREGGFTDHDDDLLLALGSHAGAALDSARLQADLRSSYLGSVRMLAEAIEAKDTSLRGHAEEVAESALAVGEQLGLDGARCERLLFGSLLHDVGKIGIAEAILAKPGPLTPEERRVIELHPRIGFRLLEQVPSLRAVAPSVLYHHERYDGEGYPAGLRGVEIPVEARIVGVADAFSAMTADRPYRARMGRDEACAELERGAGTQFDPEVVRLFVAEARRRDESDPAPGALRTALDDPELAARRPDGGLLGLTAAALVDPLTLLYSRRYLDEMLARRVERAAAASEPFALALVELAELDRLNRAEGLAAGDEELAAAGRAVQELAARSGGVAGRFSGRRFAVVLPAGGVSRAEAVADLRARLGTRAGARCAAAEWQPGDRPVDVVARASSALNGPVPAA